MLRDTWVMFVREHLQRRRQSFWLVAGLLQPVLYLLLFGPLLQRMMPNATAAMRRETWVLFVPALLMQVALTQGSFVGLGMLVEYRVGLFGRLRVAPAARASLLFGKLGDIAVAVVFLSGVIVVCCRLFTAFDAPLAGIVVAVLVNTGLALALASVSFGIALRVKKEEQLGSAINLVLVPLLLLSGAFLPITATTAPGWLYRISLFNPVTYLLDASRAALRGDFLASDLAVGGAVLAVGLAAAAAFAIRTFVQDHE
ncbi:ABC transporter permease [Actinoplanes sp. CA-131856]